MTAPSLEFIQALESEFTDPRRRRDRKWLEDVARRYGTSLALVETVAQGRTFITESFTEGGTMPEDPRVVTVARILKTHPGPRGKEVAEAYLQLTESESEAGSEPDLSKLSTQQLATLADLVVPRR